MLERVLPILRYIVFGSGELPKGSQKGSTTMPSLRGQEVTISVIKADVGSIGGHTRPSPTMIRHAERAIEGAIREGLIVDGFATFIGDDTALNMLHTRGENSQDVHLFASTTFFEMTGIAEREGLYGAGQDLLESAPSGNVRGAGPGAAEIEFVLLPDRRSAESMMIFSADKCGPGMFNPYIRDVLTSPDVNGGLLIASPQRAGFTVKIIDMSPGAKQAITLTLPEDRDAMAALLRTPDVFAVKSVYSGQHPEEKLMDCTTDRLHSFGPTVYKGKDDPVLIVRNQGLSLAPEEILRPWTNPRRTTGGARGSSVQYPFPSAINTPVTGAYCQTLVACIGFSVSEEGKFSERVDFFAWPVWDWTRQQVSKLANQLYREGFNEMAIASSGELAYTGLRDLDEALLARFEPID